jgi:hypothetical protein
MGMVREWMAGAPVEVVVAGGLGWASFAGWRMELEERVRRANMIVIVIVGASLIGGSFVVCGAIGRSCCCCGMVGDLRTEERDRHYE